MAFTRFTSAAKPGRETWVVKADGTDASRLTRSIVLDDPNLGQEFVPEWAPDGSRLAAVTVAKKGGLWWGQIVIIDPVSGRVQVVTEPTKTKKELGSLSPTWTPDSKRVVFVRHSGDGHSGFDLASVGADGSHRAVVSTKRSEFEPAVQPSSGAGAARLAAVQGADLAGKYDVELAPHPETCKGYVNCNEFTPLDIELVVTGSAEAGYSLSVAGHDTPMSEQGAAYIASGELPEDLTTATCDGQPWKTNFEMTFTVDATDKAPGTTPGPPWAQDLRGSYKEVNPPGTCDPRRSSTRSRERGLPSRNTPPDEYGAGMAKQKSRRGDPKDHTAQGSSGGPPGKKQRRKVRRNNKAR